MFRKQSNLRNESEIIQIIESLLLDIQRKAGNSSFVKKTAADIFHVHVGELLDTQLVSELKSKLVSIINSGKKTEIIKLAKEAQTALNDYEKRTTRLNSYINPKDIIKTKDYLNDCN